jgi:hypothetical protein
MFWSSAVKCRLIRSIEGASKRRSLYLSTPWSESAEPVISTERSNCPSCCETGKDSNSSPWSVARATPE